MRALKAHVKAGRLLLDEPTELPDGAEARVALVDEGKTTMSRWEDVEARILARLRG